MYTKSFWIGCNVNWITACVPLTILIWSFYDENNEKMKKKVKYDFACASYMCLTSTLGRL